MARIGFHASHELFSPSTLLRCAVRAEQAGFSGGSCSDHFHPWTERGGQSGFAWSWLGAAMAQTSLPWGTVCAPGQRYHPAIVAQAAATLAAMYPDRFWLALGTGEALNEHITGSDWPSPDVRKQRLRQSVDVIRALWRGELVTHHGLIHVHEARLFTLPPAPPPLLGAAISEESARWAGTWADGLLTVSKKPQELRQTIAAFRESAGTDKPVYIQTAISFANSDAEAVAAAHDRWRHATLTGEQLADLRSPGQFDRAAEQASPEEVAACVRASSDLQLHKSWLQEDLAGGADMIYLHPIGPNLEQCIDEFGERVIPEL